VVCEKSVPSRLWPPPMSVKDRWVAPREHVLNVPITCWCCGPGKPSDWLSIEHCLFPTTSFAVVGKKLGTGPRIRRSSSCGLCRGLFFSRAVDLFKSVNDFTNGCYALTV
jgi:hypothetical protein